MSLNDIVEDGSGQVIELTITQDDVAVDISTFTTTREIIFKGPDGKIVTKTATFSSDGSDGKIRCTMAAGDINQKGTWYVQAYIDSGSQDVYSVPLDFEVKERLQ